MIPSIWVEEYKYGKCLAQSWLEPNISRIYTPQLKSWVSLLRSTPMKMEQIESSETSAPKAQTPGDYPKDTIRHSTQGESFKSRYVRVAAIRPIFQRVITTRANISHIWTSWCTAFYPLISWKCVKYCHCIIHNGSFYFGFN